MSEITEIETHAQSFSTREVPWMKLGKLVDQPKTALEAAKLSGLDFTVSLCDAGYVQGEIGSNPVWKPIPSRKAIIADDNGDFMGFASARMYQTLQYAEAFDFMDTLGAPYVAAGGLRKRRQGFMVVKPDIDLDVFDGEDSHELYAVLRTSHDCSRGIEVSVMPLRGRCMNQLTLQSFAKGVDYRWSIKHTTTMQAKLKEAQDSLKKIGIYAQNFKKLTNRLLEIEPTPKTARKLLEITIPQPSGKTDRVTEQWQERITAIMTSWTESPTVAYAGTGWGLVNAVSEFYEWSRDGGTAESRFLNALEGETHKKINKITGLLLAGVS